MVTSATETNILPILRELNHYSRSGDSELVKAAILGIARCAMKCTNEKSIDKCLGILGRAIRARNGIFLANRINIEMQSTPATLALRTLIQLNPNSYGRYVELLAQSLSEVHSPAARAEIIWLLGEFASRFAAQATDVLRISLNDFVEQVLPPNLTTNNRMKM